METDLEERRRILRERWNALKLEVLVPAALRDEELDAIIKFCADQEDTSLYLEMPVTVARFAPEVREELLSFAKNKYPDRTKSGKNPDALGKDTARLLNRYNSDLSLIHQTLFGIHPCTGMGDFDYQLGHFKRRRTTHIHVDDLTGTFEYISRLGDKIPILAINGRKMVAAMREIPRLIKQAINGNRGTMQKLIDLKILEPVEPGAVVLMATQGFDGLPDFDNAWDYNLGYELQGTLHGSSPVPKGGTYCFFLRTSARVAAPGM
jgi:hypothetical protein